MRKKIAKIIAFIGLGSMLAVNLLASQPDRVLQSTPQQQTPNQTTPSVYDQKKPQPFILDNFKVIEMTLKHFGIDSAELANYIKEGKKLEDVLKEEKISVKRFKRRVMEEYFKAVDEGVANKQLTKEQASQLKNAIKDTVKGWLPRK